MNRKKQWRIIKKQKQKGTRVFFFSPRSRLGEKEGEVGLPTQDISGRAFQQTKRSRGAKIFFFSILLTSSFLLFTIALLRKKAIRSTPHP